MRVMWRGHTQEPYVSFTNMNVVKGKKFSYKEIWRRSKPKEMTISEVSEALGYNVKIVGE